MSNAEHCAHGVSNSQPCMDCSRENYARRNAEKTADGLDKELAGLTNDQLDYVKSRIECLLRERDGVPVEQQEAAPSSGEVWGKIISVLQSEGREAVELVVRTPFQEVVVLEIKMLSPRPGKAS